MADSFEEAIYEAEERGARSARATRAARTKEKRVAHERTVAREQERRKTVQTRGRQDTRRQKALTERERERTRRHTTEQSQRTARELSRERASAERLRAQDRAARRRSRRSGGGGGGGPSVPQVSTSGVEMSKVTATNIVLGCIVGSALAVSFRNIKSSAGGPQGITLKNGQVIRVPANLRSLGGVMLAGTAALILVQINTPLGVIFGILLLLDSGFGTALGNFSNSFFGGAKPHPVAINPTTGGASNLPTTLPPHGGIWEPGGNPGVQPGSGPGGGPIEVPYGSPSG